MAVMNQNQAQPGTSKSKLYSQAGVSNNAGIGSTPSPNAPVDKRPDPSNGALPEYSDPNYKIPDVNRPTMTPQLGDQFKSQLGAAQDYKNNFNQNSDNLFNSYAATARQNLAGNIGQVKNNANARGLLNSGMEKNAEAGQIANTNQGLDQTRSAINSGQLTNLNQMQNNAANVAGVVSQPGPNTAMPALGGVASNIGAMTQNQGLLNQIYGQGAGAVGTLGGYGLANIMGNSTPNTSYAGNPTYGNYNLGANTNLGSYATPSAYAGVPDFNSVNTSLGYK